MRPHPGDQVRPSLTFILTADRGDRLWLIRGFRWASFGMKFRISGWFFFPTRQELMTDSVSKLPLFPSSVQLETSLPVPHVHNTLSALTLGPELTREWRNGREKRAPCYLTLTSCTAAQNHAVFAILTAAMAKHLLHCQWPRCRHAALKLFFIGSFPQRHESLLFKFQSSSRGCGSHLQAATH